MKWKEINKNYKFKDSSIVTQRHQTHLYDCYEVEYNDKKIVLSKDHIIQVNIENLPLEAQIEIKELCKGKIPLTEDIHAEVLAYVNEKEKEQINKWLRGEDIGILVDDLSENTIECYVFNFPNRKFGVEVIVKRIPLTWESQKIDENNYWIPVEGLAYLFNKYGELLI